MSATTGRHISLSEHHWGSARFVAESRAGCDSLYAFVLTAYLTDKVKKGKQLWPTRK